MNGSPYDPVPFATGPASSARPTSSALWWATVGWWWRPLCWAGRVLLWIFAWPLGLWRSLRRSQKRGRR